MESGCNQANHRGRLAIGNGLDSTIEMTGVICSQTSLVNLKVEWGGRADLRRCVLLPLRKRFDSRQSSTIWRAFQKLGVDTHLLFCGITSSYVTQKYTERLLAILMTVKLWEYS